MRKLTLALLGTLIVATPAAALDAQARRHLDHLAHGGLGTRLSDADAARVRGLHKRYAALPKAEQATKHALSARHSAERAGYQPVTKLTNGAFPSFYPGLGEVYVRPKSLPVGPFLTFDRKGHQISTVYMLSLEEMNSHKKFDAIGTRTPRTNHVTVYYHGGHPGVDFPHYHYVLWHVSKKDEARVAK